MAGLKAHEFLDTLLDKWNPLNANPNGDFFTKLVVPAPSDNKIANINAIKDKIKTLYLVFHYPQFKPSTTPLEDTKFESNPIVPTDRIFNYIDGSTVETKLLLSSKGITKDNMVALKMLLSELVADATTEDTALALLNKTDNSYKLTDSPTLGGNNTILPKTSGGKGKNKSNKRIKKLRKRNKSSKSQL